MLNWKIILRISWSIIINVLLQILLRPSALQGEGVMLESHSQKGEVHYNEDQSYHLLLALELL
jgi:hypothetical protein